MSGRAARATLSRVVSVTSEHAATARYKKLSAAVNAKRAPKQPKGRHQVKMAESVITALREKESPDKKKPRCGHGEALSTARRGTKVCFDTYPRTRPPTRGLPTHQPPDFLPRGAQRRHAFFFINPPTHLSLLVAHTHTHKLRAPARGHGACKIQPEQA